jgi:glycosyltransferase involved in cell wall biosynthesis
MPLGLEGAQGASSSALREEQPDIFHANLTWPLSCKYGLFAAALARVPGILATLHSFPPVDYSWSTRFQLLLLARFVDCYIVVSRAMGKRLPQAFWIPRAKIRVIYNGVSEAPYTTPSHSGFPAVDGSSPVVFTAARLDEKKGLEYLLQAAILVPEARFVVAGEGPLCNQLKRMVGEHELRIEYSSSASDGDCRSGWRRPVRAAFAFRGLLPILEAMAAETGGCHSDRRC